MDAAVQEAKDQAELNELLIWSSARGLLADAVELIARGAEPTVKDKQGLTPAHYAAAQGHLDVLQYLATKGADLEAEDPQARMPLHYAAVGSNVEVLRFLIQRSTWLDAADAADDTPLHLAARHGWVAGIKLLLAAHPALDIANKRGLSALGEAAAGGHSAAAQTLIASGADVGGRAAGYTLLHVAAGLGQADALQLLLQQPVGKPLINDTANGDAASPLHAAAMAGSSACVQLLLQHGANAGLAGVGGLLPWELVQADTDAAQQQLIKQLQDAARAAQGGPGKKGTPAGAAAGANTATAASKSSQQGGSISSAAAGADADADADADAALGPVAAYSAQFARLNPLEQGRKIDTFARMTEADLAQLEFLSDAAKVAIGQVRRAHSLLACYRAVAALRSDETFQEDAAEPAVQAALHEMAVSSNMDKYKDDRQIMSVAAKLKKFHTVLQECGGVRLGLQDILVKPGQTLAQLMEQDAEQIQGLTAAATAARAAAIAAVAGKPLAAVAAADRDAAAAAVNQGATPGAGKASKQGTVSEIESVDAETKDNAAGIASQAAAELDLDLQLQQHKQQAAATVAASSKPLEEMGFGERMRYELINSFKQALKIMSMVLVMWGMMWCFGLLPWQQDPAELEARMQQLLQAREQAAQQQDLLAAQQGVAGGGHGGEL